MNNSLKITLLTVLLIGFFHQDANAYEIPRRRIEIKPYLNLMLPHDLVEDGRGENIVKNMPGFGFGVKIHNQVYRSFGFIIDFSFTDLEVTDSSMSTATMFTGGGYIARETKIGEFALNLGYGVISVADYSRALFMPGIEYSRFLSDRAALSAGMDWVVPNDWLYSYSLKANYKTFSFFLGCGIIF
jgi:hypothetical protein